MYKRYYDGYGSHRNNIDQGEIIVPEKNNVTYESNENTASDITTSATANNMSKNSFEIDDLILIGLLIFLLKGCDEPDPIMIIVVGYLIISEIL